MGKRGRPPHPDILTPREWQVLALLREGLTNEQIALRLDISLATAKYHVSEILSKLNVTTREQAAAWQPSGEQRRWRWALAPATVVGAAIAVAITVLIAGLGVLASGILQGEGEERREPTFGQDSNASETTVVATSQQALEIVLDQLTHTGWLQPNESPEVTVEGERLEGMLYGEAAERAREFGVDLQVQPEGWVCPQYAGCPSAGKPADARGWLVIVRGLLGRLPDPQADGQHPQTTRQGSG